MVRKPPDPFGSCQREYNFSALFARRDRCGSVVSRRVASSDIVVTGKLERFMLFFYLEITRGRQYFPATLHTFLNSPYLVQWVYQWIKNQKHLWIC